MDVTLLHATPLKVAIIAARQCWASMDTSDSNLEIIDDLVGEKDSELLYRVGNKFKHASILEHLTYSFKIKGITRACLQELARHRMQNLSVESTRYTLSKLLKRAKPFIKNDDNNNSCYKWHTASKYVKFVGDIDNMTNESDIAVNKSIIEQLETLRKTHNISNDKLKYALPEAYKVSLVSTFNARSLQNFLKLRTSSAALPEIRALANSMYTQLPEHHKFLFKEFVQSTKEITND